MAEPGRPLAASEYWFEDLAAGDQYETGHLTQLEFEVRAAIFAGDQIEASVHVARARLSTERAFSPSHSES